MRSLSFVLVLFACGGSSTPAPALLPVHDEARVDARPELRQRLASDVYAFFRFTNQALAERVCRRFEPYRAVMPEVNLHGDAHVEQYAVTRNGQGLADYDDAAQGPAVLDLVRFGISLRLVGRLEQWDSSLAIESLFEGYRWGLAHEEQSPTPALCGSIQEGLGEDRSEFLGYVDSLMLPLAPDDEPQFMSGYERYVALVREREPSLPEGFFALERVGEHRGGLGSALDKKFLVRVRGVSEEPNDDVVLEAKEVRDMSNVSCARRGFGAFSILLSQSNIGRQDPRFLAQIPRDPNEGVDDRPFWVHEWVADYHELALDDLRSAEDLREVAYDVGVQLGQGHVRGVPEALDAQLRSEQRRMVNELHDEMRTAIDELSELVVLSWQAFREEHGGS